MFVDAVAREGSFLQSMQKVFVFRESNDTFSWFLHLFSRKKWVCDQNARYVIRLEDAIAKWWLGPGVSQVHYLQACLHSSLDLGQVLPLHTAIFSPVKSQGWIGLSVSSLLEGSQRKD